jgi:hypothetical protein
MSNLKDCGKREKNKRMAPFTGNIFLRESGSPDDLISIH